MPRQAREKTLYGIYHITQRGSGQQPLFQNREDRKKWLSILKKAREKFQFRLYAFCASQDDEYHLVINLQGADLSSIMKSINISYAMYASCSGRLFRDRYVSKRITEREDLLQVMAEIHRRSNASSNKQDPYNSFCCYRGDSEGLLLPSDMQDIKTDCSDKAPSTRTESSEDCLNCITNMEDAKSRLMEIAAVNEENLVTLFSNKEKRNHLIHHFRRSSTLSLKQLGHLFGGLSESSISKILNK